MSTASQAALSELTALDCDSDLAVLVSDPAESSLSSSTDILTPSKDQDINSGVLLNGLERAINQLSITSAVHSKADFMDRPDVIEPRYFDKFLKKRFVPQNHIPIRKEFARLARHMEWLPPTKRRHCTHDNDYLKRKNYCNERNQCFTQELRYHGDIQVGFLPALQNLCEELGVKKIPTSITKCKKVLHTYHINIFDFIDARRAGTAIPRFQSRAALLEYTANGNIFPKAAAKASGVPVFMEVLFHGQS